MSAVVRAGHPAKARKRVSPLGVVAPPEMSIETSEFSGSLATLFTCVRDRKVDLLGVPLAPICESYFFYLMQGGSVDLDEAAAALAALAYLLERKAWSLLPIADPEPEPEELPEAIEPTTWEYAAAVEALRLFHEERSVLFFRPIGGALPYELPVELSDLRVSDLADALARAMDRVQPAEPPRPPTSRRSIAEQMHAVLGMLSVEPKRLWQIVPGTPTRLEIAYTFLAVLELIRLSQAKLRWKGSEPLFSRP